MSGRYYEIDTARGYGIILVIVGHALKLCVGDDAFASSLITVIYSFHMPLFFLISGFLSIRILELSADSRGKYLNSKAIRLLVPYLSMSIIYIPLKLLVSDYAVKSFEAVDAWKILIGESPNTTMWFLYTLFISNVVAVIFVRKNNITLFWLMSFAMGLAAEIFGIEYRPAVYLFYFISGIMFRLHYEKIRKHLSYKVLILAAIIFLISNALNLYKSININYPIAAISGSLLVWIISNMRTSATSLISTLGRSSMDIYILSDPILTIARIVLMSILHITPWIALVLVIMSGLFMPLIVSKLIVRRNKYLEFLLLGEPLAD